MRPALKTVINVATKPGRVQELIQLMNDDDESKNVVSKPARTTRRFLFAKDVRRVSKREEVANQTQAEDFQAGARGATRFRWPRSH